jgi:hypothetical protein
VIRSHATLRARIFTLTRIHSFTSAGAGAKDLGINEDTLGNWVNADKRRRSEGNGALSEDGQLPAGAPDCQARTGPPAERAAALRCRQASSQHPAGNRRYRADWQGELFLCRHCAVRLRPVLAAQGWSTWLIGKPVFATSAR